MSIEQYDGQPIADAILAGNYDEDIEVLRSALRSRAEYVQRAAAVAMAGKLRRGDWIEVTGRIKPRYIIGLRGRVKRVERERAFIEWHVHDAHYARRYGHGGEIGIPLNCVAKIDEPSPAQVYNERAQLKTAEQIAAELAGGALVTDANGNTRRVRKKGRS